VKEIPGPGITQFVKNKKEDFKMIILFGTDDVNQFLKRKILMAFDRRPDILGEIDRCPVAPQKNLGLRLIGGFIGFPRKINNDRPIFSFVEVTVLDASSG
jgi:hypothetical protein